MDNNIFNSNGVLPQDSGKVNFQQKVIAKSYTPVVTGISGAYATRARYQQVGDIIHVFVDLFPTAGTLSSLGAAWQISLPIKSGLLPYTGAFRSLSFVASNAGTIISNGQADLTNSRINFATALGTTSATISIYGTYLAN